MLVANGPGSAQGRVKRQCADVRQKPRALWNRLKASSWTFRVSVEACVRTDRQIHQIARQPSAATADIQNARAGRQHAVLIEKVAESGGDFFKSRFAARAADQRLELER